jgi:hypothetical protein
MLSSLFIGAGACGGGTTETSGGGGITVVEPADPVGSVNQSGERNVSATIGTPGGTLSLHNGARVEFPAGTLGEAVDVHFSLGTQTQAFNNLDYERPVGPTLHLQPEIPLSSGAVTVSIPAAQIASGFTEAQLNLALEVPADHQRSEVMGSTQTTWTHLSARAQNGRFVAEITHSVPGMRLQFTVSEE